MQQQAEFFVKNSYQIMFQKVLLIFYYQAFYQQFFLKIKAIQNYICG